MIWFKRKRKALALMDSNGRVFATYEDEKLQRLEMFRRRGYIINRFDMKEGK